MSENTRFDQGTYESSKKYLKSAMENMLAAGRNVRDLSEFALEKFGDEFLPYLRQFLSDVRHGSIDIEGLTHSAKATILGHHVSLDEREHMIREAAYLRSERRGFAVGYEHEDWLAAEKEVDERLEREAGLVAKGRKAVVSVTTLAEKEFDAIKKAVPQWLEEKLGIAGKSEKKAASKKKATAASKKTVKAVTPPKDKPKKEKKNAPAEKSKAATTAKKTVKKKAAKKTELTTKNLPAEK